MRAGAAALQHTLTLQAAVVLKNAVADARRRGHPQVQPLHVAAMLLAFPGSPLRQACMQSHPYTASHPLHCRALELCFNVALERLPASLPTTMGMQSPGLSNALVAALRRAQAQQRRGCPEQQQQPLLAVKVEMEHLVISILDDPSVSRVMREAGFNSTHVKCNMEEAAVCTTPQASASSHIADPSSIGLSCAGSQAYGGSNLQLARFGRKGSLSPMAGIGGSGESCRRAELGLAQDAADGSRKNSKPGKFPAGLPSGVSCEEDVRHVVQILLKQKKRNPILVGDTAPTLNLVVQELAQRIETGNVPTQLQGVQFLSPKFTSLASGMYSREDMDRRLGELRKLVDKCMPAGAILYLGDLQWLVEPMPEGFMAFCPVEHAALELGRLLLLYGSHRVWVIGTASSRTYMRFQSRHSLLESQWELQPVSFSAGIVLPSETRTNIGRSGSSLQSLPWHHATQQEKASLWPSVEEEINSWSCCSECMLNCEREHVLLQEQEKAKQQLESTQSCSSSLHGDANEMSHSLVQAVSSQQEKHIHAMHFKCSQGSKDAELTPELQKKWQETCHKLHCHKQAPQVSWEAPLEPSSSSSPASADVTKLHSRFQIPQNCICQPAAAHGTGSPDIIKGSSLAAGWLSPRLVTNSWLKPSSWLSNTMPGVHGGQINKWPGMQCSKNTGKDILSLDCSSRQVICGSLSCRQDGESNKTIRHKGVVTELALRTPYVEALPQLTLGGDTHVSCRISSIQPSTQCEPVQDFDSSSSSVQNPGQHTVPCLLPQEAKSQDVEQEVPSNPVKSFQIPTVGAMQPLHRREGLPGVSKQSDAEASSLCKGLISRVPWQAESIKVIANTVSECRSCMGRRRGPSIRSDTWLLLLGPDKVGKREVARGLAELVFGDEKKLVVLGCQPSKWGPNSEGPDESGIVHRGKTSLDRLVDAVRQRPFSVLLLEDVERADSLMRNSLVRAMERGRLADSHGREASFANVIVVMTANVGSEFVISHDLGRTSHLKESKLGRGTGMKLCIGETECCDPVLKDDGVTLIGHNRSGHMSGSLMCKAIFAPTLCKRKGFDSQTAAWSTYKRSKTHDAGRPTAFDLNLSAEENDIEVSTTTSWSKDGPHRLEQQVIDKVLGCARRVLSTNFCAGVDETVIFYPFGLHNFFGSVLKKLECISYRVADLGASFEVEVGVLEQMVAASWQTPGGDEALSSWIVEVLNKSLETLVSTHGDVSGKAVKLLCGDCSPYVDARPLPSTIEVMHDL